MWGVVLSVLGASVALAVVHQAIETLGQAAKPPEKPGQLAAPEHHKDFKAPADGKWKAPLWQSTTAQEALNKAKRFGKK